MNLSQERTRNYIRQIKGAVVWKVVSVGAAFLTIPHTLQYLGQEQFGVWATLLAMLSWSLFFDLGVGNGLRNKVAEAVATGDTASAASYIAAGYSLIGILAASIWVAIALLAFVIPWQQVFNTNAIPEETLRTTVQLSSLFFLGNFWVGLVSSLLGAVQMTSVIAAGQMLSNILILVAVIALNALCDSSIAMLAVTYGVCLLAPNVILTGFLYQRYPALRPPFRVERRYVSPLLNIGGQFFIIQIAALVIFTTDKIVITQVLGPAYVTPYEVVFKLFALVTFMHGMVSSPLWSAYTDAHTRGDHAWIRRTLKHQLVIFAGLVCVTAAVAAAAQPILDFWIGVTSISNLLVFAMGFYVLVAAWNNIYAMLVNGIGEIRPQLYTAIIAMTINVPLSVVLAKYAGLGVAGVVFGTACSLLVAAVVLPMQVRSIIGAR